MADGFEEHVQIDLTDFRNLPCKFTWLYQLHSKENEEAVNILEKQFYQFGFPGILHSDNGKEFKSKKMSEFCK